MPKRTIIFLLCLLMPAAFGCGRDSSHKDDQTPAQPQADAVPASQPVASAGQGIIRGRILFAGVRPVMQTLDEPSVHLEQPLSEEYALVNPNGTLKNAIVFLKDVPAASPATGRVILDQSDFRFIPHVICVRTGQTLRIRTSDTVLHNVRMQPSLNPPANIPMVQKDQTADFVFNNPEIFRVGCDVHPWMRAWIAVMGNPYFAVTGNDGTFEITGVPKGTWTLQVWHERYDQLEQQVTVSDDKPVTADFTYNVQ